MSYESHVIWRCLALSSEDPIQNAFLHEKPGMQNESLLLIPPKSRAFHTSKKKTPTPTHIKQTHSSKQKRTVESGKKTKKSCKKSDTFHQNPKDIPKNHLKKSTNFRGFPLNQRRKAKAQALRAWWRGWPCQVGPDRWWPGAAPGRN